VHFTGHGAARKDRTILLFEEENGASNPLDAQEFVREIKDKAVITFLSACQSAVAEKTEFSNLARGLVKAGVPFALGMQFNLPIPSHLRSADSFTTISHTDTASLKLQGKHAGQSNVSMNFSWV